MIYVLLADGFEEIEALAPVDILRRKKIDVLTVGIEKEYVTGAHSICVKADITINKADIKNLDGIILPGGMPGTTNLQKSSAVNELISYCDKNQLLICAICAAPMILGELNLLKGKNAVCFPGFEKHLIGATVKDAPAVTDGNIITGKGAGAALEFGAAIVDYILKKNGEGKSIIKDMEYPL